MTEASLRSALDLNGFWQLAFDPDGKGVERGWTRGNFPTNAESESVPAIWEINHPEVQGIGFYRRTFSAPAGWSGRSVNLKIGGASYRADVWLNGKYLGGHEGSYTPFRFDVTDHIRLGAENELVVRVAGLSRTQEIDGRAIQHVPHSKQTWYYIYSGLWGDVSLEARNVVAIDSVWIEPNLRQEWARIEIALENRTDQPLPARLDLEILDPDGQPQVQFSKEIALAPGISRPEFRIALPHPRAWSCETPNLYTARLVLFQGDELGDRNGTRFGMRDFTIRNGEFFLNGEPLLLRGVLYQPNFPVNLIVPPDPDMMPREIALVKEAGFNLIRTHLRPSPAGFLDFTDELGVLVYDESSIAWIRENPRLLEHCRREMQAVVERDRNHPSVVIWGIHNENRVANALSGEALVRLVRGLDPTRVVLDHSGGGLTFDQDFGWIDRTTVVANRETAREKMQDVHAYVGTPIPDGVYEWFRTLGTTPSKIDMTAYNFGSRALFEEWYRELRSYEGKIFVSELGCGGMAYLDQVIAGFGAQTQLVDAREAIAFRDALREGFRERNLERVFGSVENLVQRAQVRHAEGIVRQIEALLCNPRVSGYSITQWNDVSAEFHAGLVDHWRTPKEAYFRIQRLHRAHCFIAKADRSVGALHSSVDVSLTLVNQVQLAAGAKIELFVLNPERELIATDIRAAPAGRGIQECGTIRVQLDGERGEYRVVARVSRGDQILAETTERILALPRTDADAISKQVEWVGARPAAIAASPRRESGEGILFAALPSTLTREDWQRLLSAVESGRSAILGALEPGHVVALAALAKRNLRLDLAYGIGSWLPCYHWVPSSPLFEGLPASDLASEVYADVLPWYVPSELGGEVLAGSFRNTEVRLGPPRFLWYGDVQALQLGQGKLVLCQYRLAEHVDKPLAAQMLCNLLNLAR